MELSFQVPVDYLEEFEPLADMQFALVHLVLENMRYMEFYKATIQPVMLDNGVHEMGYPTSLGDIKRAFKMIQPNWVIPPDQFFDAKWTLEQFHIARQEFPLEQLAPVVQGNSLRQCMTCYNEYADRGVKTICIPYRLKSRLDLVARFRPHIRHHFLGLKTLVELRYLAKVVEGNWSLDTGKPFRLAQHGRNWDDEMPEKLNMLAGVDVEKAKQNISTMRGAILEGIRGRRDA